MCESQNWRDGLIVLVCWHSPIRPLFGVVESLVEHSVVAGLVRVQALSLCVLWKAWHVRKGSQTGWEDG